MGLAKRLAPTGIRTSTAAGGIGLRIYLDEFDDEEIFRLTDRQRKRFLYQAGGYIRKTAQRSLRHARKIRISELPDDDRESFLEQREDWKNGYRKSEPILKDIISQPGEPPLLHQRPKSQLRQRLRFYVEPDLSGVTIGPERTADSVAGDLEHGTGDIKQPRPFMSPAFEKFLPRLPDFYQKAVA